MMLPRAVEGEVMVGSPRVQYAPGATPNINPVVGVTATAGRGRKRKFFSFFFSTCKESCPNDITVMSNRTATENIRIMNGLI